MPSTAVIRPRSTAPGRGLTILALCFLFVSVPVETVYSWRSLGDAYYLIKVVGWCLLGWGVSRSRVENTVATVFFTAGWAWMAANFWRAVADRLRTIGAGETLRLGSVELVFAGSCLAVCLVGLIWTLARSSRTSDIR